MDENDHGGDVDGRDTAHADDPHRTGWGEPLESLPAEAWDTVIDLSLESPC